MKFKLIKFWNESTDNKRCNNPKMHNQLECMCKGLEDKLND